MSRSRNDCVDGMRGWVRKLLGGDAIAALRKRILLSLAREEKTGIGHRSQKWSRIA
jgi:hypothetical protein